MALPVLTWAQSAWQPIATTSASDYLDAVEAAITESLAWELDETSAEYRTFKPAAGSVIPDVRMMVYYSSGAGVPHASTMAPKSTGQTNLYAYMGFSVDAGTAAGAGPTLGKVQVDPTVGLPYTGARWSGFHVFDKPATAGTNQCYAVVSEEIVALFTNKSSSDTTWGLFVAGAIGFAHADDAEDADGRLWGHFGVGGTGGTNNVSSSWANTIGAASNGVLTGYSSVGVTYSQCQIADPAAPASILSCYRFEGFQTADAAQWQTTSGRTVAKALTFSFETTPRRHGGTFRQMRVGGFRQCRTVLQNLALEDVAIAWCPSLTSTLVSTLLFTMDAL